MNLRIQLYNAPGPCKYFSDRARQATERLGKPRESRKLHAFFNETCTVIRWIDWNRLDLVEVEGCGTWGWNMSQEVTI